MAKGYAEIDPWFEDQARLIRNDYDNIQLVTGREGTGKSLWMRKCARRLDPAFDVSHIHFTVEDFRQDVASLQRGRAIVLDEFRGHRRLAMHKERTDFLDFVKECRGLGLHIFIGYPRVTTFERDLVTDRISYWSHFRKRGIVEIRKPTTSLVFDMDGQPLEPTKYPLVARFPVTDKNDPLRQSYSAKKQARMRERAAQDLETVQPAAAWPEPGSAKQKHPGPRLIPQALYDEVLAALK